MNDWCTTLGLIVVVILVMIPLAMAARMVVGIFLAWRDHRAEEARRVSHDVPGLGEFTSTDGELWFGEVQELHISLASAGQPPTEARGAEIWRVIENLPRLVEHSRGYLLAHEDCGRLEGGAERFEPFGLEFENSSSFVLELCHAADDDGIYRVEFHDGLPIRSGRDD